MATTNSTGVTTQLTTGQTVANTLAQGLSPVAQAQQMFTNPNAPVGTGQPTTGWTPVQYTPVVSPSITNPSSFISSSITKPTTLEDIRALVSESNQKLQNELLTAQQPTNAEIELQRQIADLVAKQKSSELATQAGSDAIAQQVIPQGLIVGQQKALTQQSQRGQMAIANDIQAVAARLGIEQDKRKSLIDVAKTKLGFKEAEDNMTLKIWEQVQQQQQAAAAQTNQLADNARQLLNTVLANLKGTDPTKLTPDAMSSLSRIAAQVGGGLTLPVILEALNAQFNQTLAENSTGGRLVNTNGHTYLTDAKGEIIKDYGIANSEISGSGSSSIIKPLDIQRIYDTYGVRVPFGVTEQQAVEYISTAQKQQVIALATQDALKFKENKIPFEEFKQEVLADPEITDKETYLQTAQAIYGEDKSTETKTPSAAGPLKGGLQDVFGGLIDDISNVLFR